MHGRNEVVATSKPRARLLSTGAQTYHRAIALPNVGVFSVFLKSCVYLL
jgi:hypothetical protein